MYDHVAAGHLARDRIAEIKRTAEITRRIAEAEGNPSPEPHPSLVLQIWHLFRRLAAGRSLGGGLLRRAS